MKNKAELIFGISLSILSVALALLGAISNLILFLVGMICLLIGGAVLTHWGTVNYGWVCDECGENFDLTFKQRLLKINGNIKHKNLYCPSCQKETKCKRTKKN